MNYIGRFAPSPTGPLHFGSLVTALGGYLDAKLHQGQWLLRIEDLDTPRCHNTACAHIVQALQTLGLQWDGAIVYQSQRHPAYQAAFEKLHADGRVYGCGCSRQEIADSLPPQARHTTAIYAGTCSHGMPKGRVARAWRLRTHDANLVTWQDFAAGTVHENLTQTVGDFVLRRADDLWAYQLAVVVDDATAGITHIVRGADLATSTTRQVYLQQCLGLPTPDYWHLPLVLNASGEKLSKQTDAPALDLSQPIDLLNQALAHFCLPQVATKTREEFWPEAVRRWAIYRDTSASERRSLPGFH